MSDYPFISEDDFEKKFRPILNPADGGSTWEFDEIVGIPNERVWTLVDGEDGGIWAVPGRHLVNRISYVVTEIPWTDSMLDAVWVDASDLGQEDE